MTHMMKAASWNSDPNATRYSTLQHLYAAAAERRRSLVLTEPSPASAWKFVTDGDEIRASRGNGAALMSQRAFSQACAYGNAPAQYLKTLPAQLALECLSYGWLTQEPSAQRVAYYNKSEQRIEAILSDRFGPYHHADAISAAADLIKSQQLVPAHCKWEGHTDAKSLYLKGPKLFAFVMDDEGMIDGPGGVSLRRGMWIENDDSGGGSAKLGTFLFSHLCCNHIVWNASAYTERRTVHKGADVGQRFEALCREAERWMQEFDPRPLQVMAETTFATPEEALKTIYGNRNVRVLKRDLQDALDFLQTANGPELAGVGDAPALSLWGIASALTYRSQQYQPDVRNEKDVAASSLLQLVS